MRKLGLGLALALVFTVTASKAHAQGKSGYGMAGCGLGALLLGGSDNSKGIQIVAAILNGTGGQTFGITSGTSNCVEGGVVKAQREQAAFAEVNFQDLKRNMAMGGGEYLASFSTLLGCTDAAKPVFFKMTQDKYEAVLPTEKTTPIEMLMSVKQEIKTTPSLASSCTDERALAHLQGATKTTELAFAKAPQKAATK